MSWGELLTWLALGFAVASVFVAEIVDQEDGDRRRDDLD